MIHKAAAFHLNACMIIAASPLRNRGVNAESHADQGENTKAPMALPSSASSGNDVAVQSIKVARHDVTVDRLCM
jgi:hypothetical protein